MKRVFVRIMLLILSSSLLLALVSCVRHPEFSQTEPENDEPEPVAVSGGWTLNTEFAPTLTEAESGLIRGALLDYEGVGFRPAAVLAQQIVAGTNYAYLCLGETCTEPPTFDWWIVTVYEDLSGEASVTWSKRLLLSGPETRTDLEKTAPAVVGAWQIKRPQYDGVLTEKSENALAKAMAAQGRFEYGAITTLGTLETAAGTDYCVLLVTGDGEDAVLRVVKISEDLSGACSITENGILDLTAYLAR